MRLHLLALIAVVSTPFCGFAQQGIGAADDNAKAPQPAGSIQVVVKGTLVYADV
jgi:hypothetical protein